MAHTSLQSILTTATRLILIRVWNAGIYTADIAIHHECPEETYLIAGCCAGQLPNLRLIVFLCSDSHGHESGDVTATRCDPAEWRHILERLHSTHRLLDTLMNRIFASNVSSDNLHVVWLLDGGLLNTGHQTCQRLHRVVIRSTWIIVFDEDQLKCNCRRRFFELVDIFARQMAEWFDCMYLIWSVYLFTWCAYIYIYLQYVSL